MNLRYGVVLGAVFMFAACALGEHQTDKQNAMARMTYSPGKCGEGFGAHGNCTTDHARAPNSLIQAGSIQGGDSIDVVP